jgi:hypothetical protein
MKLTKGMKKRLSYGITVGEFIKELQQYDPSLYMGVGGHFGEIHLLDKDSTHQRSGYVTESGLWRDSKRMEMDFIDMEVPDIGPTPD